MSKRFKIDRSLLKLIKNKNVAAIDLHNKIVYLRHERKEDAFRFAEYGYKVYTIGEIRFVGVGTGRYVMPAGCSPVDVVGENTVITALHCVAEADMRPAKSATLLVINDALPEIARIDAYTKNYTAVRKCGRLCKLLLFFRVLPKSYINYREIAWLEAPANLSSYRPLPELETVGFLTAANREGDYMLFSPLPGKEDKIHTGMRIAYISFDYLRNQIVYIETTVTGYALANIDGYLFYLPYAYEPGKVLATPGYSGSAIKIMDINDLLNTIDG